MAKKRFDCVELQHEGADRIYEATKGMTHDQLVAWWAERDREFEAAQKARRAFEVAHEARRPKREKSGTTG